MRITDELRLFAADPYTGWVPTDKQQANLRAIADRIDAEHERQCAEAYGNGVMSVPIALDESAWVELPKDADGEYIRIGDEMARGRSRGRVIALMLSNYPKKWGGALHWGIQLEGEQAPTALDGFFRHHHAPTVEDVLREFALKVAGEECMTMRTGVVEEYASKLQLAGDAS